MVAVAGFVIVIIATVFAHDLTSLVTNYPNFGDVAALASPNSSAPPSPPAASETPRPAATETSAPRRPTTTDRSVRTLLGQTAGGDGPAPDDPAAAVTEAPTAQPTECPSEGCPPADDEAAPGEEDDPPLPVTPGSLVGTHLRASWAWTMLLLLLGAGLMGLAARSSNGSAGGGSDLAGSGGSGGGPDGGDSTPPPGTPGTLVLTQDAASAVPAGPAPAEEGSGAGGDSPGDTPTKGTAGPWTFVLNPDTPAAAPSVAESSARRPRVPDSAPLSAKRPGEITTVLAGLVASGAALFGLDDVPGAAAAAPLVVSLVPALMAGLIDSREKRSR